MGKYRKVLAEITASAAAAQNTDLFASGFKPSRPDSLVRITIAATNVVVSLVGDDAATVHLNAGTALAASGLYIFEMHLDSTRTWNIQSANIAGVTCEVCTVVEVNE